MIRFRPFLNTDPPAIAEIWRSQHPVRSMAQSVSPGVLDRMVFSKPYFDREGLIVAEEDGVPIGFTHAGFGGGEYGETLVYDEGVVLLVLVKSHEEHDQIAQQLLGHAEAYLQSLGARTIFGGGVAPLNPFYLGLIGGAALPGATHSNEPLYRLFQHAGYQTRRHIDILHRPLAGFRPLVNRQQMQVRRQYNIDLDLDPPIQNWWDACTTSYEARTRFTLTTRKQGEASGSATFWDMEPLASSWGVHASGLAHIEIPVPLRGGGLATFLVGESLRQLQSQGVTLVEAQVASDNEAAAKLLTKLGFASVDQADVLVKEV